MAPAELKLVMLSPSMRNWPVLLGVGGIVFITGIMGLVLLFLKPQIALLVAATGLAFTVWPALKAANTEYIITNVRVIVSSGIVFKSSREVVIQDIREIRISRSGVQNTMGIGVLELVGSAGTLRLEGVEEPERIRDKIRSLA